MTLIEKVARAMLADPEDWEDGMLMEEAKAAIAVVLRDYRDYPAGAYIAENHKEWVERYARENGINLDE